MAPVTKGLQRDVGDVRRYAIGEDLHPALPGPFHEGVEFRFRIRVVVVVGPGCPHQTEVLVGPQKQKPRRACPVPQQAAHLSHVVVIPLRNPSIAFQWFPLSGRHLCAIEGQPLIPPPQRDVNVPDPQQLSLIHI